MLYKENILSYIEYFYKEKVKLLKNGSNSEKKLDIAGHSLRKVSYATVTLATNQADSFANFIVANLQRA